MLVSVKIGTVYMCNNFDLRFQKYLTDYNAKYTDHEKILYVRHVNEKR